MFGTLMLTRGVLLILGRFFFLFFLVFFSLFRFGMIAKMMSINTGEVIILTNIQPNGCLFLDLASLNIKNVRSIHTIATIKMPVSIYLIWDYHILTFFYNHYLLNFSLGFFSSVFHDYRILWGVTRRHEGRLCGHLVKLHLACPTVAKPWGNLHSGKIPFSRAIRRRELGMR